MSVLAQGFGGGAGRQGPRSYSSVCIWDLSRGYFFILAFCFVVCILYIMDRYVLIFNINILVVKDVANVSESSKFST